MIMTKFIWTGAAVLVCLVAAGCCMKGAYGTGQNEYITNEQVMNIDGKYYLKTTHENGMIAGPYEYLEADDIRYKWNSVIRYRNGDSTGYLGLDGTVITDAIFEEGTQMADGVALVRKSENEFFYISSDGEKITDTYAWALPPEHQGAFGRVKKQDGWAVVSLQDGHVVTSGYDEISPLPQVTEEVTGLRDGHAELFRLNCLMDEGVDYKLISEYDEFDEISELFFGCFAIVGNNDRYGVIDFKGNVIIEPEYISVGFRDITVSDYGPGSRTVFLLYGENGEFEERIIDI